jgi:pyrimidine-nucleoside phosphorylase
MNPQDLIRKKRDGARFSAPEIDAFITGVSDGSWADYQITALVMAMFIHGLDGAEQNALVKSMLESGDRLDFSDVDAPKADKHSTGGVGDKTSLIIAPLAAACGVAVPMISGRGLGHTGGTLDKLESIDGYDVRLPKSQIKKIIKKCGFVLAGQTQKLVPADRKLYALRDAASMVESVPLIVGSIMSKKLAEGLDALVLDVKTHGRVYGKSPGRAGIGRRAGQNGQRFRRADGGADHRHEPAARKIRRQRARSLRMPADHARRS